MIAAEVPQTNALRSSAVPTQPLSKSSLWRSAYLHGALTALLLLMFAGWNGGPILYPDTARYLNPPAKLLSKLAPSIFQIEFGRDSAISEARPHLSAEEASQVEDGRAPMLAGRSPYWGLGAFLLYFTVGFQGIVIANALVLGMSLALSWSRGMNLAFDWKYYAATTALATVTPAGVFVAFLTPDIFTPVLIIAISLLVSRWDRLSVLDRFALFALASAATVSHETHVLIAVAIAGLGITLRLLTRKRVRDLRLAAIAAPVAIGIAAVILFGIVAEARTGHEAMRLPFVSAHLSDIPAAQDFLAKTCPEAGYELCNHLPQLQRGTWIDFLFKDTGRGGVFFASPQPVRDRLIEEQGRVLLQALRAEPVEIGGALVLDGLKQLVTVDLSEVDPVGHVEALRWFRQDILGYFAETRIMRKPHLFQRFDRVQSLVVLAGMGLLFLLIWRNRRDLINSKHDVGEFILLATAGVLANGGICGVSAAPLGRFQARVAFLLFFLALGLLAIQRAGRRKLRADAAAPSARPVPSLSKALPPEKVEPV